MAEHPLLFAGPSLVIAAADRIKPATISALAYSGGVMVIGGIRYVIEMAGLTLPSAVPLLRDHANQLGEVAGSVRPVCRNNQLYVEGTLARGTPAADQAIALAAAGVELAVSVGVEPTEKEYIAPGQTVQANGHTFTADNDGLVLVIKSNLKEISLVPIGADSSAFATIAASARTKGDPMPTPTFDEYLQTSGFDPVTTTADMRLALRASYDAKHGTGVDAERILAVADAFPAAVTGSDRGRVLRAAAVKGQISASGFEAGLTRIQSDFARAELAVVERPTGPAIHSSNQDTNPTVLCAAFSQSAGLPNRESHYKPEVLEAADRQYPGGLSLGEALLQAAGEAGYHGRQAIRGANLGEVLRAAFSVHTITTLLTTTGNKFCSTVLATPNKFGGPSLAPDQ
jgi:hypothetical protein